MNRIAFAATCAASLFLATAEPAHAGKGGAVPVYVTEALRYVAPTQIPGSNGTNLSLCLLTEQELLLFFLPTSYKAKAYVLTEDACDSGEYLEFNPFGFEMAQAEGLIPSDIPATPTLSNLDWAMGAWGLILGGLAIVLGILSKLYTLLPRRLRSKQGKPSALALRTLEAMCHAAKADGHLSIDEIKTIISIIQRMTGQSLGVDRVKELYQIAETDLEPEDFRRFAEGITVRERITLMEAVAMLLVSDGDVPDSEQEFLAGLAYGLDLSPQEIELIVAKYLPDQSYGSGRDDYALLPA